KQEQPYTFNFIATRICGKGLYLGPNYDTIETLVVSEKKREEPGTHQRGILEFFGFTVRSLHNTPNLSNMLVDMYFTSLLKEFTGFQIYDHMLLQLIMDHQATQQFVSIF
ncbi:hypothetical protein ACJX0J_040082, partial [Zea mays]